MRFLMYDHHYTGLCSQRESVSVHQIVEKHSKLAILA